MKRVPGSKRSPLGRGVEGGRRGFGPARGVGKGKGMVKEKKKRRRVKGGYPRGLRDQVMLTGAPFVPHVSTYKRTYAVARTLFPRVFVCTWQARATQANACPEYTCVYVCMYVRGNARSTTNRGAELPLRNRFAASAENRLKNNKTKTRRSKSNERNLEGG